MKLLTMSAMCRRLQDHRTSLQEERINLLASLTPDTCKLVRADVQGVATGIGMAIDRIDRDIQRLSAAIAADRKPDIGTNIIEQFNDLPLISEGTAS